MSTENEPTDGEVQPGVPPPSLQRPGFFNPLEQFK